MASLPRPPAVGDSTELVSGSESSFRQSEGSFNSMSTSDSASASDPGEEEFDIEALLKATKRLHAPVWKELHGTPSPLAPPPRPCPPCQCRRLLIAQPWERRPFLGTRFRLGLARLPFSHPWPSPTQGTC